MFMEMANQFATLQEMAKLFQRQLLNIEAIKTFQSYVRCASLPDPDQMNTERQTIEKAWPAYAEDQGLCLLPSPFWNMGCEARAAHPWQVGFNAKAISAWEADGKVWRHTYEARVQHTFFTNESSHPSTQ